MLSVTDLTFSYGETPLYEGVSFIVGKNQKIGLVGPNGSGKSTLLKILTGREEGYSGKVNVGGSVSIVPQEVKHDPIMEAASSVKEYVDPTNRHLVYELNKLFSGLELNVELAANPSKFSGGQKTKLALARALLSHPEILLLDEPTNFMDTAGKRWVMKFLSDYMGTVIVISHDLKLMDSAIDKVLAVNPAVKKIEEYTGNYSDYVRLKAQKDELTRKEFLVKAKHLKRMEEGYKKLGKYDSKRTIWRRRIERERQNLPSLPPEIRKIGVRLPEPAKVGEIPIRAIALSKAYGDLAVLSNLNFTIIRGERVALIGPNGAGKSTFIKIIMDMIKPDSGEVKRIQNLKVGYYSQEFETFDFNKTVLDTFTEATKKEESFARAFLGRYMFIGDKVFQKVESLSGGEKTRLSIATLTGVDNNMLILDEPTTYLDVLSQRIILEALKEYKGTMIIVSHTPEFLKELAPHKALLFPEGKTVFWDDELLDRAEQI